MPLIVRKGNPAIGEQNGLPTWNGQPWPGGGEGGGDMYRLTYDANNNAKVDVAETAEHIDWDNITNKPSLHTHSNKAALDLISTDGDNALVWNGTVFNPTVDMTRYDSDDDGIVDSAETLQGLLSTISELNSLTGATSNIQSQIDALSNITNFRGSVDTHANLSTIATPADKDMVFVLTDETMSGVTSIYIYDGSDWVYVGTFDVELRNFLVNPINLANEVTGVLDESLIDPDLIRRTDFASSLANIDNAVSLRHTHTNKTQIDKIGQDGDGNPTWNGSEWPGSSVTWSSILNRPTALLKIDIDPITGHPTWDGGDWPGSSSGTTGDVYWVNIFNKPISLVSDIDDAVSKRHEHLNLTTLDKLTDGSEFLEYNGIALDNRYVNITGDTMTGPLNVLSDATIQNNLILSQYVGYPNYPMSFLHVDTISGNVQSVNTIKESELNIEHNVNKMISIYDHGYIHNSLLPNNALKLWQSNVLYYPDDIIVNDNKLWRATKQNSSIIFNIDDWIELTGFLDQDTVYQHIISQVEDGIHGFPISTIEDETKVISVDSTGKYTLVLPQDLGLEILNIGPNALSVYTPGNYGSVTQPTKFEFAYYHPLGTASAGVKIDVFENRLMVDGTLRPVYTTDWLPPMQMRTLPFGLLNPANWYIAHLTCRDVSGRVSEARIIHFRALPSNQEHIYFANFIKNIDMNERMDFGLSNYLFLNYMSMNDMLGSTYKPTSFEILSNHTAIFIPDDVTGLTYQDFILTEYNHNDNIPLIRYVTRFKDINNQYHASHNVFKNIDLEQIKIDDLEANKDYILEIYRIDENGNATLAEQNVKTFNIDHLRSNRTIMSDSLNVNPTIPVYYFKNIPIDNVKHLGVETKPKVPTITNANVFTYVYPTDHVNIKGQEVLNFTYEHETNPVPQQRCMVRFKKEDNVYHASQEFFGTNTNILLNTNNLETNTVYTLEFFVIDENQHCNFTTIPCTTMPDGQYNYTPLHYTNTNDDIYISSTGILSLNKGVR